MLEKINIDNLINRKISDIGIAVMTLATVVGMLELPGHTPNRFVLPAQTATVTANNLNEVNNPIRREKEEAVSQYVSYSESQRTPGRSGKY